MSAADVGPARRAARRALRRLPPPAQLAVTRGLLRWRRRLRGVRTGAWARQPLLELPGGPPALLTALGGTADAEAVAAAADARRADGQGVLLVTDRDDFAAFRRRDLPFEYVPPVGDWERRAAPPAPYQAFLGPRLAALRRAYRPVAEEALPGTVPPGGGARPEPAGDRILVVSTVHVADDPRIRHRTLGALARHTPVRYATRPPRPAGPEDHEWVPLRGGRLRRGLAAAREAWRGDVALVSLHDPELLPLGLALRWVRRRPVVFDLHEDLPAQLATKPWLPRPVRRPLARVAARLLRIAERHLVITLAEPNYARLFTRSHPVLPNYPEAAAFAEPEPDGGEIVYLGSVTAARGAPEAVRAVARLDPPPLLRLIGTCAPALAAQLRAEAGRAGAPLDLPGFLPHAEALAAAARATAGIAPLTAIPNYRDSLPTKTLEYLALGVPVVASDLPGTRAVIGHLPGVQLVAPGDPEALAAALDRVRADPGWRAAAREAREIVRERYAWPGEALWEVYAGALAARRRSVAPRAAGGPVRWWSRGRTGGRPGVAPGSPRAAWRHR